MTQQELLLALDAINPAALEYHEWFATGVALKNEGLPCHIWDGWSQGDPRYKAGECDKKWESMNGAYGAAATGASIFKRARDNGWRPPPSAAAAFGWDDPIPEHAHRKPSHHAQGASPAPWDIGSVPSVVSVETVQPTTVPAIEPGWNPINDMLTYFDVIFEPEDIVGYVMTSFPGPAGKLLPHGGTHVRTQREIVSYLKKYAAEQNCIELALGTPCEESGAWIRPNPLDGKGCKNENVADFRHVLVESDDMPVEMQLSIMEALELPIAALVHSGGKSLHAIVKVEAADYKEYQDRVTYLFKVCENNGLSVDRSNRNPSRLSRLPGITRGSKQQYLIATNKGRANWDEWKNWIEDAADDLPDPETLAKVFGNPPPLAPVLIEGILREGHKGLLTGDSKAAKSFALIELAVAIAEGGRWLGRKCSKGPVLYINLELARESCIHRFVEVYKALGLPPDNIADIHIWHLRGKTVPMDSLAPKLIRRASKQGYKAVIIDPIYKVLTGDENSAADMAHFCNQFDRVCLALGAATIYCHHHSKGSQGQKKSKDRSSGSGVFARDPDAIIDLIELEISDDTRRVIENNEVRLAVLRHLDEMKIDRSDLPQDHEYVDKKIMAYAEAKLEKPRDAAYLNKVVEARKTASFASGWRMEYTLREFAPMEPSRVWFRYPVHIEDDTDLLLDAQADGEDETPKARAIKSKAKAKKIAQDKAAKASVAGDVWVHFEKEKQVSGVDFVPINVIASTMNVTEKTVRRQAGEHPFLRIKNGNVMHK